MSEVVGEALAEKVSRDIIRDFGTFNII